MDENTANKLIRHLRANTEALNRQAAAVEANTAALERAAERAAQDVTRATSSTRRTSRRVGPVVGVEFDTQPDNPSDRTNWS